MEETPEVKCKSRIISCWKFFLANSFVPKSISNVDNFQYFLDPVSFAETVSQYIADYEILKIRYKEKDGEFIQTPKIAGLMAASILKNKPITIREGFIKSEDRKLNELLAIFNGLFLCSEFPKKNIFSDLKEHKHFRTWLNNFLYLIKKRNYTTENLILVFETFCLAFCKEALCA